MLICKLFLNSIIYKFLSVCFNLLMKNIFDKFKNLFDGTKEASIKDLYDKMDTVLNQAEQDVGGNFFPEEKTLSPEEVHYHTLKLKKGADFDLISRNYAKLKEKYNPELYKSDEKKYKKALELVSRVEMAYNYFKNKFEIQE